MHVLSRQLWLCALHVLQHQVKHLTDAALTTLRALRHTVLNLIWTCLLMTCGRASSILCMDGHVVIRKERVANCWSDFVGILATPRILQPAPV